MAGLLASAFNKRVAAPRHRWTFWPGTQEALSLYPAGILPTPRARQTLRPTPECGLDRCKGAPTHGRGWPGGIPADKTGWIFGGDRLPPLTRWKPAGTWQGRGFALSEWRESRRLGRSGHSRPRFPRFPGGGSNPGHKHDTGRTRPGRQRPDSRDLPGQDRPRSADMPASGLPGLGRPAPRP